MSKLPLLCCAAAALGVSFAQSPPLTLPQTVQSALDRYPAVRASLEQVTAAAAGIDLARTSYLPRADFLGQVNRATHNNVFGMLLPQQVIGPISGPVLQTNTAASVWGSALGALVSWEPFDFGLRKANVEAAKSARVRAEADAGVTKFQVATAAADAFLTILAARHSAQAAGAGVERAAVLHRVVEALAKSGLRPGADVSRTQADLSMAEIQLVRAEQAAEVARAALAQLLGVPPADIAVDPGPLLQLPPDAGLAPEAPAAHPLAVAQNAIVEEVKAREKALSHAWAPRFFLQADAYGRGTGIQPDGITGGAASGLGPNIGNWAAGMTVLFPAFDLPSIRARREIELHRERAESARYKQVLQDLTGQIEQNAAKLAGARRVARNTPIQLEAARATEQQATARYKSGLATIVEVADAQRLLTQAEIDDALARLGVWRAMLGLAAAQGDLNPFLQKAGK